LNHCLQVWQAADLAFDMVDDLTSDPVLTITVLTPDGGLRFMAEPELDGSTLVLHRVHVQGAGANAIGAANLRVLARAVMERMDVDGLVIEGAVRTTGANPGRRPAVLRFARRVRPATEAEPRPP
jgi:hypothetical protein